MTAAKLPPLGDIISALRKAVGAVVKVADVVDTVNTAIVRSDDSDRSDWGATAEEMAELHEALGQVTLAVNQLATDELEDDLRTEQLTRAVEQLGAELRGVPSEVQELRAELRNTVHQLKAQNTRIDELVDVIQRQDTQLNELRAAFDRQAQRVSTHELDIASMKRVVLRPSDHANGAVGV